MKIAIRFSAKEELKALPVLLRHSPGMVLPNRIYVVSNGAVRALKSADIKFKVIGRDSAPTPLAEVAAGERV